MATETLYATSHITGNVPNPNNALGAPNETWAGTVNVNSSYTSRWAIDNPVNPLTEGYTNHRIYVWARKGSNSGSPTLTIRLFVNGVLISSSAAFSVTSTSGSALSVWFTTDQISDPTNIEVELILGGVGGSPSARNSPQVDAITVTVDTTVSVDQTIRHKAGGTFTSRVIRHKSGGVFSSRPIKTKIAGVWQ